MSINSAIQFTEQGRDLVIHAFNEGESAPIVRGNTGFSRIRIIKGCNKGFLKFFGQAVDVTVKVYDKATGDTEYKTLTLDKKSLQEYLIRTSINSNDIELFSGVPKVRSAVQRAFRNIAKTQAGNDPKDVKYGQLLTKHSQARYNTGTVTANRGLQHTSRSWEELFTKELESQTPNSSANSSPMSSTTPSPSRSRSTSTSVSRAPSPSPTEQALKQGLKGAFGAAHADTYNSRLSALPDHLKGAFTAQLQAISDAEAIFAAQSPTSPQTQRDLEQARTDLATAQDKLQELERLTQINSEITIQESLVTASSQLVQQLSDSSLSEASVAQATRTTEEATTTTATPTSKKKSIWGKAGAWLQKAGQDVTKVAKQASRDVESAARQAADLAKRGVKFTQTKIDLKGASVEEALQGARRNLSAAEDKLEKLKVMQVQLAHKHSEYTESPDQLPAAIAALRKKIEDAPTVITALEEQLTTKIAAERTAFNNAFEAKFGARDPLTVQAKSAESIEGYRARIDKLKAANALYLERLSQLRSQSGFKATATQLHSAIENDDPLTSSLVFRPVLEVAVAGRLGKADYEIQVIEQAHEDLFKVTRSRSNSPVTLKDIEAGQQHTRGSGASTPISAPRPNAPLGSAGTSVKSSRSEVIRGRIIEGQPNIQKLIDVAPELFADKYLPIWEGLLNDPQLKGKYDVDEMIDEAQRLNGPGLDPWTKEQSDTSKIESILTEGLEFVSDEKTFRRIFRNFSTYQQLTS